MKICFVTQDMQINGGVQRVLHRMISQFVNDEITICTYMNTGYKPYYSYNNSERFKYLGSYNAGAGLYNRIIRKLCRKYGIIISFNRTVEAFYNPERKKQLEEYFETEQFDVVIALQGTLTILISQIDRSNFPNTRLYGWVHNSYEAYFETPNAYNYGEYDIAKKYFKNLDGIITLTEHDAQMYKNNFDVNAICIYNPLSFTLIEMPDCSNKHLIFVGRIAKEQKGLDYLIEILKKVFQSKLAEEWDCLVVGDGPDLDVIKELATEAGISDRVYFLGNRDDVQALFAQSSILLSTSRWEGFGLVITEAFACGVPVVSFNNSGPSEIITNGVDGILIEKYDVNAFSNAVIDLINNNEKRKEYSKNAIKRAKDFDIDTITNKWRATILNKEAN